MTVGAELHDFFEALIVFIEAQLLWQVLRFEVDRVERNMRRLDERAEVRLHKIRLIFQTLQIKVGPSLAISGNPFQNGHPNENDRAGNRRLANLRKNLKERQHSEW